MTLTPEQADAIDCDHPLIVVKAFAGTGKTTLLQGFAKRRSHLRILYIVFNKAVQVEAAKKFRGTFVKCVTSHSLAWPSVGHKYKHKLVNNLKPYEVDKGLSLESELEKTGSFIVNWNNKLAFASILIETLTKFLYSVDREITDKHLSDKYKIVEKMMPGLKSQDVEHIIIAFTKMLWAKMIDEHDTSIGATHDMYLKVFQLSNPVLDYPWIVIDEAQDSNPVLMSILFKQSAKKVLVGDGHQQIYAWRKAKNALGFAVKSGGKEFYLTGSFRFGPNIARVANAILAIKGETHPVRGLGAMDHVGNIPEHENKTLLCRTNAGVFAHTAMALREAKSWWHVGGSEAYRFDQILDVYHLWNNDFSQIKDPFIRTFFDFNALKTYVEEIEDAELKPRCKIVEEYGDSIPEIIDQINRKEGAASSMENARISLSTAHRAKGLEWDHVALNDDFIELCELPDFSKLNPIEAKSVLKEIEEELNILYVAATRSKKVLQLNFDLYNYLKNTEWAK